MGKTGYCHTKIEPYSRTGNRQRTTDPKSLHHDAPKSGFMRGDQDTSQLGCNCVMHRDTILPEMVIRNRFDPENGPPQIHSVA